MVNLLSANLLRLRKSPLFWEMSALSFAFGAFMCITRVYERSTYGFSVSLDSVFFGYAMVMGIVMATFIPMFFGTEHSDGTIRNKLAIGHSRVAIYLSGLIVSFGAAVTFHAAYLLACIVMGIPLIGGLDLPASLTAAALCGSLLMAAAFCAIFLSVTMNQSRKATSVVVCLLGTFLLLILAVVIDAKLNAPEFIDLYSLDVDGVCTPRIEPNPAYLSGMEREVYRSLYDLLPTGQAIQYSNVAFTSPIRLMGLGAAVSMISAAAGAALFQRKDLR